MRNSIFCTFLLLTGLIAGQPAFAGGGPGGYIVVFNPNDPRSVTIANEYQQVRGIPCGKRGQSKSSDSFLIAF